MYWVCGPHSFLSNVHRGIFSLGYSGRGVKLITHLHLVSRLRTCEVIPPLPQYVFMTWCLVNHRDKFTFTNQMNEQTISIIQNQWEHKLPFMVPHGTCQHPHYINSFTAFRSESKVKVVPLSKRMEVKLHSHSTSPCSQTPSIYVLP
jgi:hypothetical protein